MHRMHAPLIRQQLSTDMCIDATADVTQQLARGVQEKGKLLELRQMLAKGLKPPVLVFVSTKERAKALCAELMYEKARVDAIHAGQSHAARAAAVTNFRNGKTWVLITTDLLARGMDFLGVQAVVNYDFPGTKTDYIHRCDLRATWVRRGRGGRDLWGGRGASLDCATTTRCAASVPSPAPLHCGC